jgi:hypothetical protein
VAVGFRRTWPLLLVGVVGCHHGPPAPVGTGAEATARQFYEAIGREDWSAAYNALHPETQRCWSAEQFARLVRAYRAGLGFEPSAVRVWACEEDGDQAVAHVIISGPPRTHGRRYKNAAELRRQGESWCIVLSAQFGARKRPEASSRALRPVRLVPDALATAGRGHTPPPASLGSGT